MILDTAQALIGKGFDPRIPTVWLLEGLLMYLSLEDTKMLMKEVGRLSADGSAVFHDAVSAAYVEGGKGPVVGGARFIGGSDDYLALWRSEAGFAASIQEDRSQNRVYDFSAAICVDRKRRRVVVDEQAPQATPGRVAGRPTVLWVTAEKQAQA